MRRFNLRSCRQLVEGFQWRFRQSGAMMLFISMEKTIFLLHIASTLFLAGVIWVVQIVQYPFFAQIGAENFVLFHETYRRRIRLVVAPPMITELLTSVALLFLAVEDIDRRLIWLGLVLTAITWLSTFFIQVPLHEKLAANFDSKTHAALVKTNWIRTAAWSLRAVLVLSIAWQTAK